MEILWRIIIGVVVLGTLGFLYHVYGNDIRSYFIGTEDVQRVYVGQNAFSVTVANTPDERKQGLSGVAGLDAYEGKLFIFDTADTWGIWMKDMNFPIDVLWFDDNRALIYVVNDMQPDSYPKVYTPPTAARYVLEVPTHTVQSLNIALGEVLLIPSALVPTE